MPPNEAVVWRRSGLATVVEGCCLDVGLDRLDVALQRLGVVADNYHDRQLLVRRVRGQQRGHQQRIGLSDRLAPAPGRARPSGACPDSNSATPCCTRDLAEPDARATAAIPLSPNDRASPDSTNRTERSSRCGSTA